MRRSSGKIDDVSLSGGSRAEAGAQAVVKAPDRARETGEAREASESRLTPEQAQRAQEILERITRVREAIKVTEGPAKWLDKRWIDPIIGSLGELLGVDWIGDIAMVLPACWIVKQGIDAGLPKWQIAKMLANIGIDLGIDLIPFIGSIADFFWKANIRNVRIMERYVAKLEKERAKTARG